MNRQSAMKMSGKGFKRIPLSSSGGRFAAETKSAFAPRLHSRQASDQALRSLTAGLRFTVAGVAYLRRQTSVSLD
jgi:hypothetical protein